MCNRCVGSATKIYWKDGKINVKSFHLPCGSWDCPVCGKRKAIVLGNRVKSAFEGERIRFATFTTAGKKSLGEHLKTLKSAWNRLRLALVRDYGLSKFFWVLEFGGERGRPHLHCLLNCYVPQRKLSELAVRAGFGSVVDIREVKNGSGFGYVYKYLCKDCGSVAGAKALKVLKGRRFGGSRNIKPIKNEDTISQAAIFTRSAVAGDTLRENAEHVARVLGSRCVRSVNREAFTEVIVNEPHKMWACGATAPQFPQVVPTFEHLQVLSGDASNATHRKWGVNSYVKLNLLSIPLDVNSEDLTRLGGLHYLNSGALARLQLPSRPFVA